MDIDEYKVDLKYNNKKLKARKQGLENQKDDAIYAQNVANDRLNVSKATITTLFREINIMRSKLGEPLLDNSEIDVKLLVAAFELKREKLKQ